MAPRPACYACTCQSSKAAHSAGPHPGSSAHRCVTHAALWSRCARCVQVRAPLPVYKTERLYGDDVRLNACSSVFTWCWSSCLPGRVISSSRGRTCCACPARTCGIWSAVPNRLLLLPLLICLPPCLPPCRCTARPRPAGQPTPCLKMWWMLFVTSSAFLGSSLSVGPAGEFWCTSVLERKFEHAFRHSKCADCYCLCALVLLCWAGRERMHLVCLTCGGQFCDFKCAGSCLLC